MYVNGFGTELVLHNILWLIALIIELGLYRTVNINDIYLWIMNINDL